MKAEMETMKSDAGRGGLATKIREAISELDRLRMAQRYGLSTDVKPADHNIVIDAMRAVDLLEHFTDAHGSEPPSTAPRPGQENKAEAADSGEWVLVPKEWQELVESFGRTVTDMFEQMERGNWVDDHGHGVRLNASMIALKPPVLEAIKLRAMLAAPSSVEGKK